MNQHPAGLNLNALFSSPLRHEWIVTQRQVLNSGDKAWSQHRRIPGLSVFIFFCGWRDVSPIFFLDVHDVHPIFLGMFIGYLGYLGMSMLILLPLHLRQERLVASTWVVAGGPWGGDLQGARSGSAAGIG